MCISSSIIPFYAKNYNRTVENRKLYQKSKSGFYPRIFPDKY